MKISFKLDVDIAEDLSGATVAIGCDTPESPLMHAAMMTATEHMMTAYALQSDCGFKQALKLLVDGARSNKARMSQGVPVQ